MTDQLSFEKMGGPEQSGNVPDEIVEDEGPAGIPSSSMTIYTETPEFDNNDLFIPRIKLAQGLTKEVQDGTAKPGQWVLSGYESLPELTVIPLRVAKRRELVDSEFTVLCKSDDAQTGVGDPGGECAVCPLAKWVPDAKGKNHPPECSFVYSYIVYVVEHDTAAVLEFKRTSINVGKALNTLIAQRGLGHFAVALHSSSNQGPKGTFHVAAISAATVPDEIMKAATQAF